MWQSSAPHMQLSSMGPTQGCSRQSGGRQMHAKSAPRPDMHAPAMRLPAGTEAVCVWGCSMYQVRLALPLTISCLACRAAPPAQRVL